MIRFRWTLCIWLAAANAAEVGPQVFGVRDLLAMNRIEEIEASPDGRRVVYGVRTADLDANREHRSLWLVEPGNSAEMPVRLSEAGADDHSPEWSGDGRYLYFLSVRSGSSQVWRLSVAGKDPVQITNLPLEVGSFRISPRSDRIFVTMVVFRHCLDLGCTRQRLFEANQSPASGLVRRQLFVGHWNEMQDGRRSQLFSIALDKRGIAAAEPVKLTIDIEGDVPGKPVGGREDYSISADGTRVAFSERDSGAAEAWMPNADIYTALASGGERAPSGRPLKDADPVDVTLENRADDLQPAFSPDGTQLAYLAADRANDPADRRHLVLLTLASGEKRPLTLNWDRSILSFAWTPDGKSLIAATDHLGQRPLWRIDTRSGGATRITGDGRVEAFSVAGNRIYYAASTLGSPPDLYSIGMDGGKPLRLTQLNEPLLAQRTLGPYEAFSFAGWNRETVHGYLVKPAGFAPEKKYPVALLLHDGPHASLADGWDWRWNAQVFAAAGFGVLMMDVHGSTGYGQAFADSVNGDLGGKPLEDLKAGIDFALRQYPWLDGVRLCALGEGYGGYLVEWIEGAWPRQFRCLVSHAGIFDYRMGYYTTDELWSPEEALGGAEFDNPAGYARQNPIDHVKDWKTPLLITHGQQDYRVPYSQGLAAFTALQRIQRPGELLIFPDEGHWIVKPANVLEWYEAVLSWIKGLTRQ